MKPLKIYHEGNFGSSAATAAAAALSHPCELLPADSTGMTEKIFNDGAPFAVFFSIPNLSLLEEIGAAAGTTPWIAALPFERHVIVTPVFASGLACVSCFVKRWLCQPPAGYQGEIVLAISMLCRDYLIGEYRNLSPMAAPIAAKLLVMNSARRSRTAICCDTASLHVESAIIRPLHGCRCRSGGTFGAERFAAFGKNLHALLQEIGGDPR